MRTLLDGMSRPQFALFSALDKSLLKLLLIRTAEIDDHKKPSKQNDGDGGDDTEEKDIEREERKEMEWYRREYFGALCRWDTDLDTPPGSVDEGTASDHGAEKIED